MSDDVDQPPGGEPPQPPVDPRRVVAKLDFEMGLSLRVIGSKAGVSEACVRKWAKEGGWVKGEAKPVQRVKPPAPPAPTVKASNVIAMPGAGAPRALASTQSACEPAADGANSANCEPTGANCEPPLDELFRQRVRDLLERPTRDEAADVAARAVVQVVMENRRGVAKVMSIVDKLAHQLDAATDMRDLIEQAVMETTEPGKYRAMLLRMVSLQGHAATARDLSTAMTKLVQLERQAFGLAVTDSPAQDKPVEHQPVEDAVFERIRGKVLRLATPT